MTTTFPNASVMNRVINVVHYEEHVKFESIQRGERFLTGHGLWVKRSDGSAVCIAHCSCTYPPGWIANGFDEGQEVQIVETTH